MRYLIEVNTTAGWKPYAGYEIYGDAVRALQEHDAAEVMLHDTLTGQKFLPDDLSLDDKHVDTVSGQDIERWLDGAHQIFHPDALAA